MSLRRIKHTFLRLTPEEKVSGLGALLVLIGIFMPWYSVVMNFDKKSITENGLSGDIGVLGFVILLMIILALLVLIGEHLHIKIPKLGYTREQMLFFLMGQSAFMVLLAIAVYTKRSLEFTDAGLRFGIYFALVGAFLGTFAIFSQIQKLKKEEVREFFEHEKPTEEAIEDEIEERIEKQSEEIEEEDQMLFEKETPPEPEPEPEPEEETIEPEEEEKIPEDEMIEEIEEIIKEEEENAPTEDELNGKDEPVESEEKKPARGGEKTEPEGQGDYFMREAGVEEDDETETDQPEEETEESDEEKEPVTDTESVADTEKTEDAESAEEEEKKDEGLSSGFYEDQ